MRLSYEEVVELDAIGRGHFNQNHVFLSTHTRSCETDCRRKALHYAVNYILMKRDGHEWRTMDQL